MSRLHSLHQFLSSIGEEVLDAEEESFLLFSRDIPSNNLGFCDSRASTIDLTIHDRDYTIHQSPTLLSSNREGGTTGAVLWKITPRFAEWISASTTNPFWIANPKILRPDAAVIELGCGISGLVALTLGPLVRRYIATDQEYVRKLFRLNIDENAATTSKSSSRKKGGNKGKKSSSSTTNIGNDGSNNSISFVPLDWELDIPSNDALLNGADDDNTRQGKTKGTRTTGKRSSKRGKDGFDLIISCDCIYNEALIPPFVRTCADICALRSLTSHGNDNEADETDEDEKEYENKDDEGTEEEATPTIAIIAQQQRSPDVFETWLRESLRYFRVWRLDSRVLAVGEEKIGLGEGSGYMVHVLVLKE